VLPHLKGKLDGIAIRVPTPNVSVVDLRPSSSSRPPSSGSTTPSAKPRLARCGDPRREPTRSWSRPTSTGTPTPSIVDLPSTALVDGNLIKVLAWYDNEWGYSSRVRDLVRFIAATL